MVGFAPFPDTVIPRAAHSRGHRRAFFDPGWLFVIAGLLLLAATVLVPAADDLHDAQFLKHRADLICQHRGQRLDRYRDYLNALDTNDPSLAVSLAASQLNQIPVGRAVIGSWPDRAGRDEASVFPALEPPPLVLPERPRVDSLLMRWSTDDRSRLWLIAAGALLVLLGLLPRAPHRAGAPNSLAQTT